VFIPHRKNALATNSTQVVKSFGLIPKEDGWLGKIAGHDQEMYMSPEDSHFSTINLLGQDFASLHGFTTKVNSKDRVITYFFGDEWDTHRKKR
jgi:hypothetical protein